MSRRGGFICSVRGCDNEWMHASFKRQQFCVDHFSLAFLAYNKYKEVTNLALDQLTDSLLKKAIRLRTKYQQQFSYEPETGPHWRFIRVLEQILNEPSQNRIKKRDHLLSNSHD